ncbi:TPA: hypothetical protein ACUJHO_001665 [Salmonella enterica]
MTITAASVIVALAIGGLEALGLIDDALQLSGTFWQTVSADHDKVIQGIYQRHPGGKQHRKNHH